MYDSNAEQNCLSIHTHVFYLICVHNALHSEFNKLRTRIKFRAIISRSYMTKYVPPYTYISTHM